MNEGNEVGGKAWLGFWAIHCSVSFLPGLLIAGKFLDLAERPVAILAMFTALATFIPVIAVVTFRMKTLRRPETLVSRGLRLGLSLRSLMVFLSVILILAGQGVWMMRAMMLLPDVWAGIGAGLSVGWILESNGHDLLSAINPNADSEMMFLAVYLVSIGDGLILSFLVFIMSFVSTLFLQMKERKKGTWIAADSASSEFPGSTGHNG